MLESYVRCMNKAWRRRPSSIVNVQALYQCPTFIYLANHENKTKHQDNQDSSFMLPLCAPYFLSWFCESHVDEDPYKLDVGLAYHVALSLRMWLLRCCEGVLVCCYAAVWPAQVKRAQVCMIIWSLYMRPIWIVHVIVWNTQIISLAAYKSNCTNLISDTRFVSFFVGERNNTFIRNYALNRSSEVSAKTFILLWKYYFKQLCSFELSTFQRILKKYMFWTI